MTFEELSTGQRSSQETANSGNYHLVTSFLSVLWSEVSKKRVPPSCLFFSLRKENAGLDKVNPIGNVREMNGEWKLAS